MITKKYNGMTYTEILNTMSNFRKYATKYKVWRIHPNRYCDKCWEDIERMKNGKPPVTLFYNYRDLKPKEVKRVYKSKFFTLNGKGKYTCRELEEILNFTNVSIYRAAQEKRVLRTGDLVQIWEN